MYVQCFIPKWRRDDWIDWMFCQERPSMKRVPRRTITLAKSVASFQVFASKKCHLNSKAFFANVFKWKLNSNNCSAMVKAVYFIVAFNCRSPHEYQVFSFRIESVLDCSYRFLATIHLLTHYFSQFTNRWILSQFRSTAVDIKEEFECLTPSRIHTGWFQVPHFGFVLLSLHLFHFHSSFFLSPSCELLHSWRSFLSVPQRLWTV